MMGKTFLTNIIEYFRLISVFLRLSNGASTCTVSDNALVDFGYVFKFSLNFEAVSAFFRVFISLTIVLDYSIVDVFLDRC